MDQIAIPQAVQDLHAAYLGAMGFEPEDLPLGETYLRWWFNASKEGISPDGIRLLIKERLKFNAKGSFTKGIEIKHICRDPEDIAVALNEIAVIRARMRVKIMPSGRAEAMRATGRSDEVATDPAKHVSSVELIQKLKQAAS